MWANLACLSGGHANLCCLCLQYICAPTGVLSSNKLYYTAFIPIADKTNFIIFLILIAFCVPGVGFWIAVGVVVSNPPNGSKWIFMHN